MNRSLRGFTLIEIMIVVAIVAILAAVALPSYQQYVQKTRRSDALNALEKTAARQEQYYFQFNQYTDNETLLGGSGNSINSPEGFYAVSAAFDSGNNQTYILTVTPPAGSPQAQDGDCSRLTLNHLGQRAAQDGDGNDNTALCWSR